MNLETIMLWNMTMRDLVNWGLWLLVFVRAYQTILVYQMRMEVNRSTNKSNL